MELMLKFGKNKRKLFKEKCLIIANDLIKINFVKSE
jgi:hypothetical protein